MNVPLTLAKTPINAPDIKIGKQQETKREYSPRTYSEFINGVKNGEIPEVLINPNAGTAKFFDSEGNYGDTRIAPNQELWRVLMNSETNIAVDTKTEATASDSLTMFFILLLIFAVIRGLLSGGGGAGGMPNPFENTMKFDTDTQVETRFDDVEGIDNAKRELEELVSFLREPEKYIGSGARIPRGALLTGKPGTGKTLLARAIAGESSVPFIQCSASSFVEMFVGVGAKRVRELFATARKLQPCIVFIDEIDAIGKSRSSGGFASNDEREQTINQLLTEMDGFSNDSQIVVIGATNRIDVLDEALLRPGRFDRKIQVSLPTLKGREKILGVHSRDKNLDESVELREVAKQTTGFSGADLANLMNECAIKSVEESKGIITNEVIEDVYQRIIVGSKGDSKFSAAKKELVAYHEAGHAIIGVLVPEYDQVRKVSIIPRGDAGGITFFQPIEENADIALYSKKYLISQIKVLLGGRGAEEVIYGQDNVTTGASSDFSQVYRIAREMVTTYGLGTHRYDYNNLSQGAARQIDLEIDAIVKECYESVLSSLRDNRLKLERLKDKLIEEEIVEGEWVYDLMDVEMQANKSIDLV
tara:strand:+ start:9478 stop:11244 length:1767 start_codon:yes stop_codon:yes gene_type:complete